MWKPPTLTPLQGFFVTAFGDNRFGQCGAASMSGEGLLPSSVPPVLFNGSYPIQVSLRITLLKHHHRVESLIVPRVSRRRKKRRLPSTHTTKTHAQHQHHPQPITLTRKHTELLMRSRLLHDINRCCDADASRRGEQVASSWRNSMAVTESGAVVQLGVRNMTHAAAEARRAASRVAFLPLAGHQVMAVACGWQV